MKVIMNIKNKGHLILIFPSGTRYRPGDPSTKRGVREIDSYIKSFDYMCMIAINGEVLHVQQQSMLEDTVSLDVVRITAGPVLSCTEFRDQVRAEADKTSMDKESIDKKQAVADAIMTELEKLHAIGEIKRKQYLR